MFGLLKNCLPFGISTMLDLVDSIVGLAGTPHRHYTLDMFLSFHSSNPHEVLKVHWMLKERLSNTAFSAPFSSFSSDWANLTQNVPFYIS